MIWLFLFRIIPNHQGLQASISPEDQLQNEPAEKETQNDNWLFLVLQLPVWMVFLVLKKYWKWAIILSLYRYAWIESKKIKIKRTLPDFFQLRVWILRYVLLVPYLPLLDPWTEHEIIHYFTTRNIPPCGLLLERALHQFRPRKYSTVSCHRYER